MWDKTELVPPYAGNQWLREARRELSQSDNNENAKLGGMTFVSSHSLIWDKTKAVSPTARREIATG